MLNLAYKLKDGNDLLFDDYINESEDYGTYYVLMCEDCRRKYAENFKHEPKAVTSGANGICSVCGCENEADYYIDFDTSHVSLKMKE